MTSAQATTDFNDKHDVIAAVEATLGDHDAGEIVTDSGTYEIEQQSDVIPVTLGEPDGVIVSGEHVATDDVDEVRPATDDPAFACSDCDNVVRSPMPVSKCVECGGDLRLEGGDQDDRLRIGVFLGPGREVAVDRLPPVRVIDPYPDDRKNDDPKAAFFSDLASTVAESIGATLDDLEIDTTLGELVVDGSSWGFDPVDDLGDQGENDDAPFEGNVEGEPADSDGMHTESDTFVLLACSSLKAADEDDDVDEDDALPARDQYRGSLFKKSKKYAETIDAPYAILSGKYGVLEPDDEIEYYDVSVYARDSDEWGEQMVAGNGMTGPQGLRWLRLSRYDEIVVFAGRAYRDPIADYLDALDVDVSVPLEGASGIGEMLSDMNDLLDELDDDEQGDRAPELPSEIGNWILSRSENTVTYGATADVDMYSLVHAVLSSDGEDWNVYVDGPGETNRITIEESTTWSYGLKRLFDYVESTTPDEARASIDAFERSESADDQDEPDVAIDERAGVLESAGLSEREAQVVALKEQGLTHGEIADEIGKSKSSVDEYSRRAGKKVEKARALLDTADDVFA